MLERRPGKGSRLDFVNRTPDKWRCNMRVLANNERGKVTTGE